MDPRHLRLAWCEPIVLPRRFARLACIVDPDDPRTASDASVERHATSLDGERESLLPGLHAWPGFGRIIAQQLAAPRTTRRNLVVPGDCEHGAQSQTAPKHDGAYVPFDIILRSVRDRLRTMHRIDGALRSDLSRLLVLHDGERWRDMPLGAEVEGSGSLGPGEIAPLPGVRVACEPSGAGWTFERTQEGSGQ